MKRLHFLLTLLVAVSAEQAVRASSSEGYGVKAYAAGALATAGALGGAYKLIGRYQAGQAVEAARKDSMAVKVNQFNTLFESSRQQLENQLISFLASSGKVYDVCVEYGDKFQELVTKLEEMVFKIEHAHVPHTKKAYSDAQSGLLANTKRLLDEVKHQRGFAARWATQLDKSYEQFINHVAMLFNDIATVEPQYKDILWEWRSSIVGGKSVWLKKAKAWEASRERWIPVRLLDETLPNSGSLGQIEIDLKQYYKRFADEYAVYMDAYNKQYGSYFTRLKGYFRGYFKSKPAEEASTVIAPAA